MKEKDYIEEMIQNNLELLNDSEPEEGHFERFEAKLKARDKIRRFTWKTTLKIAAVVIFVLLVTNQVSIYMSPETKGLAGLVLKSEKTADISLASLSPEYKEVEFYYTTSINTGLSQWNELNKAGFISEDEQAMMDDELKEFESIYKNLQTDLAANPYDERVINAMLEFYQVKLSVITMIVTKLEEVKQQKNNQYENS